MSCEVNQLFIKGFLTFSGLWVYKHPQKGVIPGLKDFFKGFTTKTYPLNTLPKRLKVLKFTDKTLSLVYQDCIQAYEGLGELKSAYYFSTGQLKVSLKAGLRFTVTKNPSDLFQFTRGGIAFDIQKAFPSILSTENLSPFCEQNFLSDLQVFGLGLLLYTLGRFLPYHYSFYKVTFLLF